MQCNTKQKQNIESLFVTLAASYLHHFPAVQWGFTASGKAIGKHTPRTRATLVKTHNKYHFGSGRFWQENSVITALFVWSATWLSSIECIVTTKNEWSFQLVHKKIIIITVKPVLTVTCSDQTVFSTWVKQMILEVNRLCFMSWWPVNSWFAPCVQFISHTGTMILQVWCPILWYYPTRAQSQLGIFLNYGQFSTSGISPYNGFNS